MAKHSQFRKISSFEAFPGAGAVSKFRDVYSDVGSNLGIITRI